MQALEVLENTKESIEGAIDITVSLDLSFEEGLPGSQEALEGYWKGLGLEVPDERGRIAYAVGLEVALAIVKSEIKNLV